jgi:hypothetical protein
MNRSSLSSLVLTCAGPFFAAVCGLNAVGVADDLSWETATAQLQSGGVRMVRDGSKLCLQFDDDLGRLEIPRFCASVREVVWEDGNPSSIKLTPEQESWRIESQRKNTQGKTMVLICGSPPLLPSEVQPVSSQADGSYYLPAHMATTAGEKVRFEPQSYKNTVGYWVGKQDTATWSVAVEKTGRFNVAVLQGCGRGQGGSTAGMTFTLKSALKMKPVGEVEFEVLETGHFQNFHWRQLGVVELPEGMVNVRVAPKRIAKNALMDLRAIHLVRLPDPKK